MHFFATAARGTEPALRDELREIGLRSVRADRGGVHFEGDWPDGWRACIHARVALTVLVRLAVFPAPTSAALYDGVRALDWTPWLSPHHTLAVQAVCRDSLLRHGIFVAQRVKDAIVDQFRDRVGARPSIDRHDPDVRVFVRLHRDQATVTLDLAGDSLHRRGYRSEGGPAPLRETLAAAVLRLAGWDRKAPLLDPMCGSGTLAIEAAWWAEGRPPGLARAHFGCERWPLHDAGMAARLAQVRDEARAGMHSSTAEIVAGDRDGDALARARLHAERAGVSIRFYRGALETDMPSFPQPAFIVANPPYGHRIPGDDFAAPAAALRARPADTVALLAGHPAVARAMRRRPARQTALWNGPLPCRLLVYTGRANTTAQGE